ncbi:metallophosphoesterase family protein, partial [Saccharococcus caldoxylosilyticus]|uniref:metallophosphoesterase family protein n=1 Tax=Saccharococcus caldoxylosilyticus TaxID=81408 RepID=UPI000367FFA3
IQQVQQSVIVCGHTHVPFLRKVSGKTIVNPGSVGLPSGAQGACWALLGPDLTFIETPFDRKQAAKEIRNTGAPYAWEFAEHILHPLVSGP